MNFKNRYREFKSSRNEEKKLRKLKTLIHKYFNYISIDSIENDFDLIKHLDKQIERYSKYGKLFDGENYYKAHKKMKEIVIDLDIDKDKFLKMYVDVLRKRYKKNEELKGSYVGSGNSNKNKIRYPKKSKSNKTWKIFYNMFPERALIDGYDGKTSKRMK